MPDSSAENSPIEKPVKPVAPASVTVDSKPLVEKPLKTPAPAAVAVDPKPAAAVSKQLSPLTVALGVVTILLVIVGLILWAQIGTLKQTIVENQNHADQRAVAVAQLKTEWDTTVVDLAARQKEVDEAKAKNVLLNGTLDKTKLTLADVQSQLDRTRAISNGFQSQMEDARVTSIRYQGEAENAKAQATVMETQLNAARADAARLKSQLDKARANAASLQERLTKAESEIAVLQKARAPKK